MQAHLRVRGGQALGSRGDSFTVRVHQELITNMSHQSQLGKCYNRNMGTCGKLKTHFLSADLKHTSTSLFHNDPRKTCKQISL